MAEKNSDEFPFEVYDSVANEFVEVEALAEEKWCRDLEGTLCFALLEDGSLILCDEEGKYIECPRNRFTVRFCEVD